jgi:hypothetical protein
MVMAWPDGEMVGDICGEGAGDVGSSGSTEGDRVAARRKWLEE